MNRFYFCRDVLNGEKEIMKKLLLISSILLVSGYVHASNVVQNIFIPTAVGVSSAPAVSGASALVTISTPPAPGQSTGWSNYITNIHIEEVATGGIASASTPVTCTSTNMSGNPAWNFPPAITTGTLTVMDFQYANPLTPVTAQANTTLTCPATSKIQWNINVNYFQAP